jgi:hypothetical protein
MLLAIGMIGTAEAMSMGQKYAVLSHLVCVHAGTMLVS